MTHLSRWPAARRSRSRRSTRENITDPFKLTCSQPTLALDNHYFTWIQYSVNMHKRLPSDSVIVKDRPKVYIFCKLNK